MIAKKFVLLHAIIANLKEISIKGELSEAVR